MLLSSRSTTRRSFLKASAVGFGAMAATMSPLHRVLAADPFPEENFNVVVATGAGGGAERIARVFDQVWRKYLNEVFFEYEFHPGAGGLVGYQVYMTRREPNGYNLLFSAMGPEMIGHTLSRTPWKFPDDWHYFTRVDIDDSVIFVSRTSRWESVEQLVEEGRRRPINVAVSRIPHPASIGILALGEATGARFNLIPYGGGGPTVTAVMSGEVDCGGLPSGNPIQLKDRLKVVGVFSDENRLAPLMENPPSINGVFGTNIPNLPMARAWGIHTSVRETYPDRYEILVSTARKVFDDPEFEERYRQTGAPWEAIQYGDEAACTEYVSYMIELTERFRDRLEGADEV